MASEDSVRPIKKKRAVRSESLVPGPRERVISSLLGDEVEIPTPTEAIGELNKAVKNWNRITGLYNLLCSLQEGIPAGDRVFPVLEIPQAGGDSNIVIDPSQWTQSDQLELINLLLQNTIDGYHKQLGALADAAVTGVASFSGG